MKPRLIALLIALFASTAVVSHAEESGDRPTTAVVTAADVRITSSLDKNTASVAEAVHLKLSVEAPQGSRVEWPTLDKKLGLLDLTRVTKSNDVPSVSNSNTREWVMELALESIKTGELTVPSLDIRVATSAAADFESVQSPPLQVHIASVLEDRADPTHFRDIKQTVDAPIPAMGSKRWMLWAGGGGTAALALLLIAVGVKRRNRGPAPAAWALASLADVQRMNSADADAAHQFNEVVEIVREYLKLEFGIEAVSRTTGEFLSTGVEEIELPAKTTERLKWLASVADEIKFARLDIGWQHFEQAIAQAKALVAECDQHRRTLMKGTA